MSGFLLGERRGLFILKGKSNRLDLSRKFRHRSLELLAQRKNIVHADSPLGLLACPRNSQRSLGLPTSVGTPDSQATKSQSIGTSGGSWDFRHSELPTSVRTSDGRRCAGRLRLSQQAPRLSAPNVGTSDYQKSTNYV